MDKGFYQILDLKSKIYSSFSFVLLEHKALYKYCEVRHELHGLDDGEVVGPVVELQGRGPVLRVTQSHPADCRSGLLVLVG